MVILLVSSFLFALLPVTQVFGADPTPLTLKWTNYNVAGGGESLLTYDIFPGIAGEEIIHGGGPVAPNSGGSVTCILSLIHISEPTRPY